MPIYDYGYGIDLAYGKLIAAWEKYLLGKGCGRTKAWKVAAYKAERKIPVPA